MEDMKPFHGLRGVCAMAIFLGHQTDMFLASPFHPQKNWGLELGLEYLQAVSLFFLLSGIPLVRLYLYPSASSHNHNHKEAGTSVSVHTWAGTYTFWRKRGARLAPTYYLALTLNLVVIWFCFQTVEIKATLESFVGCALLWQSLVPSWIDVGGVLWQVSVFALGYALFPFVAPSIATWSDRGLTLGIGALWLFSAGLFGSVVVVSPETLWTLVWYIWHVHAICRLPQVFAGVMLGALVERARRDGDSDSDRHSYSWSLLTDALSLVLLGTAVLSPIVQHCYGTMIRTDVSIGLEALLMPLHAVWLAGIVLAYRRSHDGRVCWTRSVLSMKPLLALGEVSLVLYCLHIPVLFLYTSALAYAATGDRHVCISLQDPQPSFLVPWWHAPIQWALVIAISFAVNRYYEAPLRRLLGGSYPPHSAAGMSINDDGRAPVGRDSEPASAEFLADANDYEAAAAPLIASRDGETVSPRRYGASATVAT